MTPTPREPTLGDAYDDDDEGLPLLTDAIDEGAEDDGDELIDFGAADDDTPTPPRPPAPTFAPAPPRPPAPRPAAPPGDLDDILDELNIELRAAMETWIDEALPQIILRELDSVAERIHDAALANLRTTVLAQIPARIARTLRERENQADPL